MENTNKNESLKKVSTNNKKINVGIEEKQSSKRNIIVNNKSNVIIKNKDNVARNIKNNSGVNEKKDVLSTNKNNYNQSKIMINKENSQKSLENVSKKEFQKELKDNNKIDDTIIIKRKKNGIDEETKVYNFQKELREQKAKSEEKIQTNIKKNGISNNNINKENIKLENKTIDKSNQKIVKEAEKIVNSVMIEEKENNINVSKNKTKNKVLKVFLLFLIILLVVIVFSTIFGLLNINNNKIIKGVCVNNIDVSSFTKEEAISKLENELNSNEKNYIIVKHKDYEKRIYLKDINAKFDVKEAANVAYQVGRDNNIVFNNYNILYTMFVNTNINAVFSFDEDLLQKQINKISLELPNMATDSTYVIDENNLIIKNSKDGYQINTEKFKESIINSFSGKEKSFEIVVEKCERKEIDIDKIYKEVYKEPKNAYYTTNPYQIFKEENGLDFAITIDEAKKMLLENKEEYIIPLKKTKPKITVAKLDSKAFPDKLGTFTTYYSASDVNRNANIALAAKSITSVVLMPGEVFSYNDLIGECSTRTGYKESTIYLNGELAKGVGGGICQVSTTLYNAVLRANLEIVQRRNHSLSVTYVPMGQDAMVSIGSQDFQFKNNRDYPIKVVASTGPTSITCQILGLKQDTEYEVKLYSRVISKTDTKTKVETYKLLYLNGKEVSRTWLSTDSYKNH